MSLRLRWANKRALGPWIQCSAKVAKTWGQMSQQPWKLGDIFKTSETLAFFLKIHWNAFRMQYLGATVCPKRNKWSWSLQPRYPTRLSTAHRCWIFSAKLVLVYKGAKCCITLIYIAIVREIMHFFIHAKSSSQRKFYLRKLLIFLPSNLNMCFGCSGGPSHWDGSFEYPHHMFWMRNKENNIPLRTLIWRPGYSHLKWCLIAWRSHCVCFK